MNDNYTILLFPISLCLIAQVFIDMKYTIRYFRKWQRKPYKSIILAPYEAYLLILFIITQYVLGFLFFFLGNRANGNAAAQSFRNAAWSIAVFSIQPKFCLP